MPSHEKITADIAITNGYVLPMGGGEPLSGGTVLIRGNKIAAVSNTLTPEQWQADKVINAQGNVVMPGFVNCHTHIASNILLKGLNEDMQLFEWLQYMWKMKQNFDPEVQYWANMSGLLEMVRGGTTAFNEHFDAYAVEPEVEALKAIPMRATLGYGLVDRGLYDTVIDWSWHALDNFADKVEMHHNSQEGRVQVALSPHATYSCGPELWRRCRQVADQFGVSIHTHLAEGIQEWKYVGETYGSTPAQWLASLGVLGPDTTLAHCTKLDKEDIQLLADTGAKVAHCPISNAKLCSGYMPIQEMLDAGVHIGLATDGPASHNTLDMFQEMKFAAIIHKNNYLNPELLPIRQMLELATSQAAITMHRDNIGYLAEGMAADVIVVDTNRPHTMPLYDPEAALVYSSRPDDVTHTIIDGRLIMEDRKVAGIDEQEILRELRKRALQLKKRSL